MTHPDRYRLGSLPHAVTVFARRHDLGLGLAFTIGVAALSMVLTMQGWRSRFIAIDLITYVYSADRFLAGGELPQHGDTGSYGSFGPPGTAWLMIPSRMLSNDPRLAEYVGAALLHLATLIGIFLLTRRHFGAWPASAAVVLYGLSAHGLFLAGSLWPIGRPDFYVWTVLLASLWVTRRDSRFLAAGLAVCAIGMYIDMALAPAFLIFPALWFYGRPPVRIAPLVVAAALVLIIWLPYLQFQVNRGFVDLTSQLLLQDVFPADYRAAWCDPNRQLLTFGGQGSGGAAPARLGTGDLGWPERMVAVVAGAAEKALSTFTSATPLPGGGMALAALVAASLLAYGALAAEPPVDPERTNRHARRRAAAAGLVLLGALPYLLPLAELFGLSESDVGVAKRVGLGLALGGVGLGVLPWLAGATRRFMSRASIRFPVDARRRPRLLLILALLVPWLALVALAEPGRPERFWWLWPVQVIFLAALLFELLPRYAPRFLALLAQVLVVALILWNPEATGRLSSWRASGWAGVDAVEVQVVDYVGGRLREAGQDQAAIGYQTIIYPFMASYHVVDPLYKVGAEFDLFLWYRHGIKNTDRCAEGLSDADEYRIIQTRRHPPESWAPDAYFHVELDPAYRMTRDFGLYEVWVREPGA